MTQTLHIRVIKIDGHAILMLWSVAKKGTTACMLSVRKQKQACIQEVILKKPLTTYRRLSRRRAGAAGVIFSSIRFNRIDCSANAKRGKAQRRQQKMLCFPGHLARDLFTQDLLVPQKHYIGAGAPGVRLELPYSRVVHIVWRVKTAVVA